jgi:hypothetical protein
MAIALHGKTIDPSAKPMETLIDHEETTIATT